MRVSFENLTFTTFLSPLLTRCYRFLNMMNIICGFHKYNVRRCDVLVQNKTIHSLNLSHLIEYFFKMAPEPLVNPPCDTRARSLHYRF